MKRAMIALIIIMARIAPVAPGIPRTHARTPKTHASIHVRDLQGLMLGYMLGIHARNS